MVIIVLFNYSPVLSLLSKNLVLSFSLQACDNWVGALI